MRFLKEAYWQSRELADFVYNAQRRFNEYYYVTLKLDDGRETINNFRDEDSALEYYDNLKKLADEDKDYYADAQISMHRVSVILDDSEDRFEYLNEADAFANEEEIID